MTVTIPVCSFMIFPSPSSSVSVKFPPNIVNIHVKHPPEASVQFHQVSRIDGPTGQKMKEAQPGPPQISYPGLPAQKPQAVHSTYSHRQVTPRVYPVAAKTQLGRCFQETVGAQVSRVPAHFSFALFHRSHLNKRCRGCTSLSSE